MGGIGTVDLPGFGQSRGAIIRGHEGVRTIFVPVEGPPTQVIEPGGSLPLVRIDLRQLSSVSREDAMLRLAAEEAARPFDLARGPMVRATLVHMADDQYVPLLVLHHTVSDGWSMGVLVRELMGLYSALL